MKGRDDMRTREAGGKTSLVVCVYSLDSIVPSEPYHYVQVPPAPLAGCPGASD